jgi:hypothetical protein
VLALVGDDRLAHAEIAAVRRSRTLDRYASSLLRELDLTDRQGLADDYRGHGKEAPGLDRTDRLVHS